MDGCSNVLLLVDWKSPDGDGWRAPTGANNVCPPYEMQSMPPAQCKWCYMPSGSGAKYTSCSNRRYMPQHKIYARTKYTQGSNRGYMKQGSYLKKGAAPCVSNWCLAGFCLFYAFLSLWFQIWILLYVCPAIKALTSWDPCLCKPEATSVSSFLFPILKSIFGAWLKFFSFSQWQSPLSN